ncbi:Uma2 family endonuclease [cf. Phormidesmis sp. LEGE 11477]|uniref:Uma2 family endonuclease n=1 Tax=cf. Phormidesmis sp. LEGE 11477 TaxID=1828680 RepID=UPI0018824B33|nr:Uma2 family endonuclease [cf. Phormidesmis sp. LEGE 11477]MBE9059866.1 Uma2 family endonuclease [cf. Phormidesmis sp. LEGE 11477]
MTAAVESTARPVPIAPLPKPVSFEQFIDWYPENSEYRYELRRGVIFKVPKPRGKHSEIAGYIAKQLNYAIDAATLPYLIPRECVVKVSDSTGYEPDVVVLDRAAIATEPLWDKASTVENGSSVKLAIEVVSSNWQDDYELKLAAYESMQIPQYWIVDYAGLGGVRHIGKPKQPTLSVCTLVEGEYEVVRLRGQEPVMSMAFPDLTLRAEQFLSQP